MELTLPNGVTTSYSYDPASDLTGLTYATAGGTSLGAITYTYDAAGRRVSQSGSLASDTLPAGTTAAATVNLDNRLTSWNGQAYSYDADGNLTGNGADTYVWNARNQLAQIKQGTWVIASFSYDPLGRRVDTNLNGATTGYLYDGLNAVLETHGNTATSILNELAVDERFARTDTSGRTDFLTDALNSTIGLTNSSGALVEQYTYDPYGNTTASSSAFNNTFQYTGRENDGTGLYFYRARYYAPEQGRFISEDPMGFAGGENFYAYVSGNPLSYTDPYGMWQLTGTVGVGIAVLFTVGDNGGQWSFGAYGGIGEGGSFSYNPSTDTTECGTYYGIRGNTNFGLGDTLDIDSYMGLNGYSSSGFTLSDPFVSNTAWGVEEVNGQAQPVQLLIGGGESGFLGFGATWYGGR